MSTPLLQTENLKLVLQSPEEVRASIDAMSTADKAQLSADWLARALGAETSDAWTHGFSLILRADDAVVGSAGFKGPPSADGMVEIAYGVAEDHQRRGYATEAARAMVDYAFAHDAVRLVRAHTLPEVNASTRVLTKCGFQKVGEVIDPDDGPVWRWERQRET